MPLYEYRCNPCGEFEAWHSLAEYNTPTNCPNCGRSAKKIFSSPNINLNSGNLSAIANSQSTEPRLVKKKRAEPTRPKYQNSSSSRPWMVYH